MKSTPQRQMLAIAIAAAITLGGSFTGVVTNAYADEAPAASAVTDPQALASQLGINLHLNNLAVYTNIAAGIDSSPDEATALGSALDATSQGRTLEQFALSTGAFTSEQDYLSKLEALTNQDVDFALNTGDLTADQAKALKAYANGVIAKAVTDVNYVEN